MEFVNRVTGDAPAALAGAEATAGVGAEAPVGARAATTCPLKLVEPLEALGIVRAAYTQCEHDEWNVLNPDALPRYRALEEQLGLPTGAAVRMDQKHTADVRVVTAEDAGEGVHFRRWDVPYDGMVTNVPGLMLGTTTADCVPVSLVDPVAHAIGLVHSGWRGTVACIAERAIALMSEQYGTRPADIVAFVGPHICRDCFEFGRDDAAQLGRFACEPYVRDAGEERPAKVLVDMNACIRDTLCACGVSEDNIHFSSECSLESPGVLASRRRQPGTQYTTLSVLALSV